MTLPCAILRPPRQSRRGLAHGYVVWEGPSRFDGQPIAVILTGLRRPSRNPKTGPMAQVWVIRADTIPHQAVGTGDDASVCNGCEFRPTVARWLDAQAPGSPTRHRPRCYVRADTAVSAVYRAYQAGSYPTIGRRKLARLLRQFQVRVRGGAYGNLSNAPLWVSRIWAQPGLRHTQYDHAWADPRRRRFATIAMASVGSPSQRQLAHALGWRTFRVKQPEEPVLPGERECPAQSKFTQPRRQPITCFTCGACHGHGGRGPGALVDIVIDDHGPTSQVAQQHRDAARTALRLVNA